MKAFFTGHGHKMPAGHCGETLALCWLVFLAEILHIMYALGGMFKLCSALVIAVPYRLR